MKGDKINLKEKEAELLAQKKEHRLIQVSVENVQQQFHNKKDELQSLTEREEYIMKCIALAKSQKIADQTSRPKATRLEAPVETNSDPKQSLQLDEIFERRTKEYFLKILQLKNIQAKIDHEDDLRLTFGTRATINELYTKGNMTKVNITLFTKKVSGITKDICILADFCNTIKDVLQESARFWKVKMEDYILTDEKYVSLPGELTIGKIFLATGGNQVINLLMHFKTSLCFEIIKQQEESIQIMAGNAQAAGQSDNKLQKKITVRKNPTAKLDNAPQKFFSRYPLSTEYIHLDQLEPKDGGTKNKTNDIFYHQGPVVFYSVLAILIIQFIQLFHYDIEVMYNMRTSLDKAFLVNQPKTPYQLGVASTPTTSNTNYYSRIAGATQFGTWLDRVIYNIFRHQDEARNNLFSAKTLIIGEAALLRFDTMQKSCSDKAPASAYCIETVYDEKTRKINSTEMSKFFTNEQLGISYSLSGMNSDYNAGAHLISLGKDTNTADEISDKLTDIISTITSNTLAINLVVTGYILDMDYFYNVNFLVERTPSGGFLPTLSKYDIFRPTLSWNYPFNIVGDIIVYILSIVSLGINIRTLIRKYKTTRLDKHGVLERSNFWAFTKKILFVLTMIFFIIQCIYGVVNTAAQIKYSGASLLEATSFVDGRSAASDFITCLRLKAFNTGVAVLMMAVLLNHKITQKFTITILNETIIKNIQYLFLVIPIFVGMALVGTLVLGPYSGEFAYFDKAMISVMLYTIGRISPGKIVKYDSEMGLIFVLIFYILSVFLTFTIFIGFALQTYFVVMSSQGYYTPSWDNSNFQYFPQFAFFFIPKRFFQKKVISADEKKKLADGASPGASSFSKSFSQYATAKTGTQK